MEDSGLFFWLIIFAVAILQGIGQRKKKAGRKPGAGTLPGPGPSRPRPAQVPAQRPDQRPDQRPQQGLPEPSSQPISASAGEVPSKGKDGSSEGMIPSEIWEEILGLAQGKPPRSEPDAVPREDEGLIPVPTDETGGAGSPTEQEAWQERPGETRPAAVAPQRGTRAPPSERAFPASHGAEAALHKTKPSDVGSRLAVSASPDPTTGAGEGRSRAAGLFGGGSPEELRKAIILKEVLGQPLALRED